MSSRAGWRGACDTRVNSSKHDLCSGTAPQACAPANSARWEAVRFPISPFPAPQRVCVATNLPGECCFTQAKLFPERDNLAGREGVFSRARPRKIRRGAISRNEILDQLAIGTDRRILTPFPSGDGRFVDTEFCCQLLLGQLNLDAGRQFATVYAICV